MASMVEALDQGQDINLAKRLSQIKFILYGEEEREPDEARCAAAFPTVCIPGTAVVLVLCFISLVPEMCTYQQSEYFLRTSYL